MRCDGGCGGGGQQNQNPFCIVQVHKEYKRLVENVVIKNNSFVELVAENETDDIFHVIRGNVFFFCQFAANKQ